jgi:chromosome segregation ATPase
LEQLDKKIEELTASLADGKTNSEDLTARLKTSEQMAAKLRSSEEQLESSYASAKKNLEISTEEKKFFEAKIKEKEAKITEAEEKLAEMQNLADQTNLGMLQHQKDLSDKHKTIDEMDLLKNEMQK